MRYYWDEFEVARALKLPAVSLFNITGNLPGVLAGSLAFTVLMREHDAVYCEWGGHRFYAVLQRVSPWNGIFQFLWSGSPQLVGAKPDGTCWHESPLWFPFRELSFSRGFLALGPRTSEVLIGRDPGGVFS